MNNPFVIDAKKYENYESYLNHQKEKTLDPDKRKKWLNEEWDLKIDGFKGEFEKIKDFLTEDKRCLCLGARTGQEVVALQQLGIKNAIGVDIVPHLPNVIEGDAHNLDFEDNSFDFVYSNIINYSIDPKKMISEVERVLSSNGIFFLQCYTGLSQDPYIVNKFNNPLYDICTLFDQSYCLAMNKANEDGSPNFAGMNISIIFKKDKKLSDLFIKYGNLQTIEIPEKYEMLWNEINLPIQNQKLTNSNILDPIKRKEILTGLKKRAYYLTRIAETYKAKNILEVGTAEGWQFFSFGEYAKNTEGKVYSCDPRDVRSKKHIKEYEDVCFYYKNDSNYLGSLEDISDIDMFYIDGLHDENTVINDVVNLANKQNKNSIPVWVFDDFDIRFGCFKDIALIINSSNGFKIWDVGLTGSGQPSHQVMINALIQVKS